MNFKVHILRKLYRRRVIGAKHTAVENLTKSIPSHVIGEAKQIVDTLIKEGLILEKSTNYGLQVSLNPEKIAEIEAILKS